MELIDPVADRIGNTADEQFRRDIWRALVMRSRARRQSDTLAKGRMLLDAAATEDTALARAIQRQGRAAVEACGPWVQAYQ